MSQRGRHIQAEEARSASIWFSSSNSRMRILLAWSFDSTSSAESCGRCRTIVEAMTSAIQRLVCDGRHERQRLVQVGGGGGSAERERSKNNK